MNNRMQELARQSTGASTIYMLEEEWLEFANLIVKECGLIVDELAGGQMGGASSYDLNKHFGIVT